MSDAPPPSGSPDFVVPDHDEIGGLDVPSPPIDPRRVPASEDPASDEPASNEPASEDPVTDTALDPVDDRPFSEQAAALGVFVIEGSDGVHHDTIVFPADETKTPTEAVSSRTQVFLLDDRTPASESENRGQGLVLEGPTGTVSSPTASTRPAAGVVSVGLRAEDYAATDLDEHLSTKLRRLIPDRTERAQPFYLRQRTWVVAGSLLILALAPRVLDGGLSTVNMLNPPETGFEVIEDPVDQTTPAAPVGVGEDPEGWQIGTGGTGSAATTPTTVRTRRPPRVALAPTTGDGDAAPGPESTAGGPPSSDPATTLPPCPAPTPGAEPPADCDPGVAASTTTPTPDATTPSTAANSTTAPPSVPPTTTAPTTAPPTTGTTPTTAPTTAAPTTAAPTTRPPTTAPTTPSTTTPTPTTVPPTTGTTPTTAPPTTGTTATTTETTAAPDPPRNPDEVP